MKKKYIQPLQRIVECGTTQPILSLSQTNQQIKVYDDETIDPEDALVKENSFEFSWD